MKSVFFLIILCRSSSLFGQVEFDSTRCINEYINDIKSAVKDTCMVSLTIGDSENHKKIYVVPSILATVQNLYELTIKTNKFLEITEGKYNFKFLWDVYVTAKISKKTFPKNIFSSSLLNSITLYYKNGIGEIPLAILNKKRSNAVCALILFGFEKAKNNSVTFYKDLEVLLKAGKFKIIDLYRCYFSTKQQDYLKKLAFPNSLNFYNDK